jgi:hypothetical protein
LLELRRADPVDTLFVILHLLKAEAEVTGQLCLRDACFPAAQTDSPPVCTENLIRVDDVMESPKLAG